MIIGNGDIASILPKRDDLLFFASGVSNSLETKEEEYDRELYLLAQQNTSNHIVYFSSLSIFYNNTRYTRHKKFVENYIKRNYKDYTIVRLGNITWGNNPNTLINFLSNKFKKGESVEIRDEYRYVCNEDEFLHWINLIPNFSCEINIPGKRMKVIEILQRIKEGTL